MKKISLLFLGTFFLFSATLSQPSDQQLKNEVLHTDSLFWTAYNNCDNASYTKFMTKDLEFYHDKGGMLSGAEALSNSIKKNICGNANYKIRREAVPGTVQVYLMRKSGEVYASILSGDHYFYTKDGNNPETRDGLAKFMTLWLLDNGAWKMSRVFSYDHGPANR